MRANVRLACCGAQGTGRSATALALADALALPYLPDFAITLAAERDLDPRLLRHDPEVYARFEHDVVDAQIAAELALPEGFVADRSLLDGLAYWSYWVTPYVDSAANRAFRDLVLGHVEAHPYHALVLPSDNELPDFDAPMVTHDPQYQRTLQMRIVGLVLRHAGNATVVRVSGDIEQRLASVQRELA